MPELRLYEDYTREEAHDLFSPDTAFVPQTGMWGLRGIIPLAGRPGDFVFFVTFGQTQGTHHFDEGISADGVFRWQSQPSQHLADPQIRNFVEHNDDQNSIYLFLRTSSRTGGAPTPYTFLGRLAYRWHDPSQEQPVYFDWQLIDWPIPSAVRTRMGLTLEGDSLPNVTAALPTEMPAADFTVTVAEPPASDMQLPASESSGTTRQLSRRDFAAEDAANRKLGLFGEELVVAFEKRRLNSAGRPDLADRVRHVAVEEGDGAGFDIISFTPEGASIFIEVKTTRGPADTAFFVTPRELAVSRSQGSAYELRRVYGIDQRTGRASFYSLVGALDAHVDLTPTAYRARLKRCASER